MKFYVAPSTVTQLRSGKELTLISAWDKPTGDYKVELTVLVGRIVHTVPRRERIRRFFQAIRNAFRQL